MSVLRLFLRGLVVLPMIILFTGMDAAVECRRPLRTAAQKRHERWMEKHGRVYSHDAEKEKRRDIFIENLKFIDEFNRQPNRSFTLAPNAFADMTNQEFRASQFSGTNKLTLNNYNNKSYINNITNDAPPTSLDWRQKGAVNPIRNQGECSVCWAFATLAAVESMTYIKSGKLPQLSVQQLVDCVYASQGKAGCHTGYGEDAYNYIIKNGGVVSDSDYPYNPESRSCDSFSPPGHQVAATITGYSTVTHDNETAMQVAVAAQPVAIQITSGSHEFQFYSGGLFTAECGTEINHMATAIGYGTTPEGKDFWLVRNQWGEGWGEGGYVRLLRNSGISGGHCSILTGATFPY